jgi:hypothetical protein
MPPGPVGRAALLVTVGVLCTAPTSEGWLVPTRAAHGLPRHLSSLDGGGFRCARARAGVSLRMNSGRDIRIWASEGDEQPPEIPRFQVSGELLR